MSRRQSAGVSLDGIEHKNNWLTLAAGQSTYRDQGVCNNKGPQHPLCSPSSPQAAEVTESMIPQTARPAMTPSLWPPHAANANMHSLPYSEDWSQSVKPAPYALATCAYDPQPQTPLASTLIMKHSMSCRAFLASSLSKREMYRIMSQYMALHRFGSLRRCRCLWCACALCVQQGGLTENTGELRKTTATMYHLHAG